MNNKRKEKKRAADLSIWTNPPLFSFALIINTIARNWTYNSY